MFAGITSPWIPGSLYSFFCVGRGIGWGQAYNCSSRIFFISAFSQKAWPSFNYVIQSVSTVSVSSSCYGEICHKATSMDQALAKACRIWIILPHRKVHRMLKSFSAFPCAEIRHSLPFNSALPVVALSCHSLTHWEGWAVQQLLLSSSLPGQLALGSPAETQKFFQEFSLAHLPKEVFSVCLSHWLRTMVHILPFSLLTSCMTQNLGGTAVILKLAGSVFSEL